MPRQASIIYGLLTVIFGGILDFVDRRQIVRRAMVLTCLWMLVDCYMWAKGYASSPSKTGADLSLVIAAILTPVTALQGFLYRMYNDGRADETRAVGSQEGSGLRKNS